MDFRISDTVYEPGTYNPRIRTKKGKKYTFYKVWIMLGGNSLHHVNYVKYILHSSFTNREHIVKRSLYNPDCKFSFWTWGIFDVKVEIHLKNGDVITRSHPLEYG